MEKNDLYSDDYKRERREADRMRNTIILWLLGFVITGMFGIAGLVLKNSNEIASLRSTSETIKEIKVILEIVREEIHKGGRFTAEDGKEVWKTIGEHGRILERHDVIIRGLEAGDKHYKEMPD